MKVINIALNEVGYTESPANSNMTKYGKWFGFDGAKWCGMFVSWVYHHAGFPLGKMDFWKGFASCQFAHNRFKAKNELTDNPKPGDIVLFDWKNDGHFDHTGIFVKKLSETTFETIEGNTSIGNDSNGGEVMIRVRKFKPGVVFVHPKILD